MTRALPLLVPGTLLLLAAAGPAQQPAPGAAADVIAIDSRVLEFAPSRPDFTVGAAVVAIHCSRPAEVRVGGAPPEGAWTTIELERVAKNRFALPPLRIEVPRGHAGVVCLSVKVWFEQVGNQHDALFYANLEDRYALVAYSTCVEGPEWEAARPRFAQNRVATLDDLRARLARPLPIRLNQRPLSDLPR